MGNSEFVRDVQNGMDTIDIIREMCGKVVRQEWIEWAKAQPAPKLSWLVPWEELDEDLKEVDRRIGYKLYLIGAESATALSKCDY